MDEVLLAHKAYYLIQKDIQKNLPHFDEVLLSFWSHLNAELLGFTKSSRRQMAKAYGVIFVIRNQADGTFTEPTATELQETESQPDGSDQLLIADVAPGTDPDDDLGVESALRDAGLSEVPDGMDDDASEEALG